jgi:hypothetical protein
MFITHTTCCAYFRTVIQHADRRKINLTDVCKANDDKGFTNVYF